jgi:lysophospholipase L1-like esterase
MKTILCYGDSNTWGYCPAQNRRLNLNERWAGVARNELGPAYWVIEEGLGGRTTVWNDPVEGEHKNGKTYLLPCLETHQPLDAVVIMLGTNDLKRRFGVGAFDIAQGAGELIKIVHKSGCGPDCKAPQALLVSPPPVASLAPTNFAEMFYGAEEKSRNLSREFKLVADELSCELLDAADIIVSSPVDAIHLEGQEHLKLGQAVAERIRQMLNANIQ